MTSDLTVLEFIVERDDITGCFIVRRVNCLWCSFAIISNKILHCIIRYVIAMVIYTPIKGKCVTGA